MQQHASLMVKLRARYLRGAGVIVPGLLNCFLSCVAGALANVASEHGSQSSWDLLTRRILVGYLGAVGVVVLLLPWLRQISIDRRRHRDRIEDWVRPPITFIEAKDIVPKGKVVAKNPFAVSVEAGKDYYWCRCGLSQLQPFCDGSHRTTEFTPVKLTAQEGGTVFFCGCRQTGFRPLRDDPHQSL